MRMIEVFLQIPILHRLFHRGDDDENTKIHSDEDDETSPIRPEPLTREPAKEQAHSGSQQKKGHAVEDDKAGGEWSFAKLVHGGRHLADDEKERSNDKRS